MANIGLILASKVNIASDLESATGICPLSQISVKSVQKWRIPKFQRTQEPGTRSDVITLLWWHFYKFLGNFADNLSNSINILNFLWLSKRERVYERGGRRGTRAMMLPYFDVLNCLCWIGLIFTETYNSKVCSLYDAPCTNKLFSGMWKRLFVECGAHILWNT